MTALKLAGIAIAAVSAAVLLKGWRSEAALSVSVAAGIAILLTAMELLFGIVTDITRLADEYGLASSYMKIALKVVGITYITQLAASICSDAGESAIGGRVELAGRLLMAAAAMPAITEALAAIGSLLSLSQR